jgi:hypothetical protein
LEKGKAFVVVGHANWGKSMTLKALTNGEWRQIWISIKKSDVRIKRMSNDDLPESLIKFLEKINSENIIYIIIALCPNFHDKSAKTLEILKLLSSKYSPFFWVMKKKYNSSEEVSDTEIQELKRYGKVTIFQNQSESKVRAEEFKKFIEANI